jgi:inhibitor of cysteine peptidase
MMKMNWGQRISLLVILCMCGCASSSSHQKIIKLNDVDDGRVVEIVNGDEFELSLISNPTTGYDWTVSEYDPAILKQMGELEYKPETELIGASGISKLKFKAIAQGKSKLKLIYHRTWEKNVPPAKTFQLSVVVL